MLKPFPQSSEALRLSPWKESRAKWELGIYTAMVIGVSGATIVMTNIWADLPPEKVLQQCVRFVLTCALMAWLWRGSFVAKWLSFYLFCSAGLFGLAAAGKIALALAQSGARPEQGAELLFAIMQATYLPFAICLVLPLSKVSLYLRYRRAVRLEGRLEREIEAELDRR